MQNDFPRVLSLLRTEKKISQRKAAGDLNISQALLSHYENGVREPGLEFVVRAADYYAVSCDYLLGRTMNRELNGMAAAELPDVSAEKGNVLKGSAYTMLQKKLIVNSSALIMEIAGGFGNRKLISAAASYLSAAIYKVYRYIYMANSANADAVFPIRSEFFSEACDAEMNQCELALKSCALGIEPDGKESERPQVPELSHRALTEGYPTLAQSLFTLLHSVSERIEKRIRN